MEDLGYAGKYIQQPSNLTRFVNWITQPSATITQEVELVDVSFWQGTIYWNNMPNNVIIRAGQGLWIDTKFERNRSEAERLGKTWGIYWFYDDRQSPSAQADMLASLFSNGAHRPQMEIFCDWENSYGGSYQGVKNVVAFMQRVEELLPWCKMGIYTGYYWFVGHTNTVTDANQLAYLKTKSLWLAWYTSNPTNVLIPRPWTKMDFWQWGTPARGYEFGCETKEIDMNWYNGTNEDFVAKYGGISQPPPPPTGETFMYNIQMTQQTKKYAQPNINSTIVGNIGGSISFQTNSRDGDFYQYTDGTWINYWKGGTPAMIVTVVVVNPPPTASKSFTLTVDGFQPFTGTLTPL